MAEEKISELDGAQLASAALAHREIHQFFQERAERKKLAMIKRFGMNAAVSSQSAQAENVNGIASSGRTGRET